MDTQLRVITANALACLTTALNANPNPPDNFGFRVEFEPPEELWPEDLCCQGLGYVAVGDVWPSTVSFPEADIVQQVRGNCPPAAWGVQLKLGIMRCVSGELNVSQADEDSAFYQDLDDIFALEKAACCLRDYFMATNSPWLGFNVIIERMVKTVQGGCKDRYMPISIQTPNCAC